ncbi:PREDICTED: putative nuclease HARBI1 [Acropora digitifera]|uniref:putative nuclease HARBI1 n=1 Tax=Acropora digitifera TaxID=70779 RepID=UPI00077B064E|nr:PREDICTED: putative nuclease HARBI1 [Acropora digitifera]
MGEHHSKTYMHAVGPAIQRQDTILREAIPLSKRAAVGLWRLATGDSYRSCGLMFGIAKSTAVGVCRDFVQALCQLKEQFIKFPNTPTTVREKIQGFREKSNFPNVVGAIDGTHMYIKAPKVNHKDYFNRKRRYSFVVQGVVDASGSYLSVSTGFPGSMHDARVLRLSNLFPLAEEKRILTMPCMELDGIQVRPLILGDSAYPLKTWLMRPFKDNGALSPAQRCFNRQLSQARIAVEHGFGQTKARWRCTDTRIDEETRNIPDTITACCVLHNICVLSHDDYEGQRVPANNHRLQYDGDDEVGAKDIRQAIVDYLV